MYDCMCLSKSLWRTSAVCRGTDKSNTSWPPPAQVAEPQCGTFARTTSLLKSATTATEYVVSLYSNAVSLNFITILWSCLLDTLFFCVYAFVFRCIALGWLGTQKWQLSWSCPRRTTGCRSSRCGIYVLLPLLSRF